MLALSPFLLPFSLTSSFSFCSFYFLLYSVGLLLLLFHSLAFFVLPWVFPCFCYFKTATPFPFAHYYYPPTPTPSPFLFPSLLLPPIASFSFSFSFSFTFSFFCLLFLCFSQFFR